MLSLVSQGTIAVCMLQFICRSLSVAVCRGHQHHPGPLQLFVGFHVIGKHCWFGSYLLRLFINCEV